MAKCAHMYFRPNLNYRGRMKCARSECYDPTLTLSVNGQKVKQVDKIKLLGVIIDDQLSWNDRIKYVENKLMSTIVLIKRKKKFIPSSHYFKIYHSLLKSHLTYGISPSWLLTTRMRSTTVHSSSVPSSSPSKSISRLSFTVAQNCLLHGFCKYSNTFST